MNKNKTLKQLQKDVEDFCGQRNWKNRDPNMLISSLVIEMAELAEHYQWQNNFDKIGKYSSKQKEQLGFEFMDVLFYLSLLANRSGIDMEKYFYLKLPRLAEKYKPNMNDKDQDKIKKIYRKTGKNKNYA